MAASQNFATVLSLPQPLVWNGGGTTTFVVAVASPMQVVWADDGSIDRFNAGLALTSVYDRGTVMNGHDFAHLIVLVKGSSAIWTCHEADFSTLGTLVAAIGGSSYALFARCDGDQVYRLPQV